MTNAWPAFDQPAPAAAPQLPSKSEAAAKLPPVTPAEPASPSVSPLASLPYIAFAQIMQTASRQLVKSDLSTRDPQPRSTQFHLQSPLRRQILGLPAIPRSFEMKFMGPSTHHSQG